MDKFMYAFYDIKKNKYFEKKSIVNCFSYFYTYHNITIFDNISDIYKEFKEGMFYIKFDYCNKKYGRKIDKKDIKIVKITSTITKEIKISEVGY